MSGSAEAAEGGNTFARIGADAGLGSQLLGLLAAEDIVPGSDPSYQLCKTIWAYHPLGAKMAEAPVTVAQSQERELSVSDGPDELLVSAFRREWASIGAGGADTVIRNAKVLSRVYGISTLVVGAVGTDPGAPLPLEDLHGLDLYFNVLDPLNTAGSLVLSQDPNSPDFQRPGVVRAGNVSYHTSRAVTVMNEQPIYIEYSNSAYGFVGRSVYQRALYPMKTFLQTMITDQFVAQKCGLLVWNATAPGSVMNQRILNFFGFKRTALRGGTTGNVLSIPATDKIESIDLNNLEGPARMARDNALKNTAMAAGMPAKLLEQETMVGGMAEGQEDAKQIATFINRERVEMRPLYAFMDQIVQRRAWSPAFYRTVQKLRPEYERVPYETAFYQWSNSFTASWPNLLAEPDSKKLESEKVRFEAVVSLFEALTPAVNVQENKAALLAWVADEVNSRRELFSSPLVIDEQIEAEYEPPAPLPAGDFEPRPETDTRL
jgi:hypothetical protein